MIDQRFDRRILVPTGPLESSGNEIRMPWVCLFVIDGVPACVDEGTEIATFRGDHIHQLKGVYLPEVAERLALWAGRYGNRVPGVAQYMAAANSTPPQASA